MATATRDEILRALARDKSLRGMNLVRAELSEIGLPRADLSGANMRMADLSKADLREARLTGAHLSGAILKEANLVGANLVEASMIGVALKGADLSRADMSGADLTGATLDGACLSGSYLVGAYLNEASLNGADLSGAYVRMAKVSGSNLTRATLESADLSHADLSGVHFEGSSLVGANLEGASLQGSFLLGCDLRGANLSGADLSGSNLTGAKLSGAKCDGIKLEDAWAEWVDVSKNGDSNERVPLEEAFSDIIARPIAEILVEGSVSENAWSVVLGHLAAFGQRHPEGGPVKLKAIQQGANSAVAYLEGETEKELATYLANLAEIIGNGSEDLLGKLGDFVDRSGRNGDREVFEPSSLLDENLDPSAPLQIPDLMPSVSTRNVDGPGAAVARSMSSSPNLDEELLKQSGFWQAEKAFVILTGERRVWMESCSSENLTLRPPHGIVAGVDLVRGRFAGERRRRPSFAPSMGDE